MDDRLYRILKWTAIILASGWVGWSIYESFFLGREAGDTAYLQADTLFEDGAYERALNQYEEALKEASDHVDAMRGRARSLMQLDRHDEALEQYGEVIAMEPGVGASYANRGILQDRMGRYPAAISDYEKALELDPKLAEGPHWLTRFLRNQAEKPPTIADRARYLREQLAKPESERVLRIPELDAEQRSYKK